MKDYMIKAMAFDNNVRAFAITAKHTVTKAIDIHKLNPVAAIALGRGLMASAMLSSMDKGKNDVTTLQVLGEGPMGGIVCIADKKGTLKGYVKNNDYESYGIDGTLGVGPSIGRGMLHIIKDIGLKKPYTGTIPLVSGEIGDDLAYYFTSSEQTPSMVALGVTLNDDASCDYAAGVIIQLMPGASDDMIDEIEANIKKMTSATALLKKEKTIENMLSFLLSNKNVKVTTRKELSYQCNCSEEKMYRGVLSLGKKALEEIAEEEEKIETVCQFCNSKYTFDSKNIKNILKDR